MKEDLCFVFVVKRNRQRSIKNVVVECVGAQLLVKKLLEGSIENFVRREKQCHTILARMV